MALACGLPAQPPRGMAGPADAPGLPELVRTKHRTFSIPFRVPPSEDPAAGAAPQRVLLSVSQDLGVTWQAAGEASPTAGAVTFTARTDGEYWFRLRAIDKQGRSRGGEGPDIRVLVDAAGPRLAARVWRGVDGEIVCRYAAADDSIDLRALKVEYRGPEDKGWKPIAAEGILARESPAHLVGEEIWWIGEKVESLTVRIAVADAAGNQVVKQFTLEPRDPQVDQAALAVEVGVPPLPAQGTVAVGPADPPDRTPVAPPAPGPTAGGGWTPEPAGSWSDGRPPTSAAGGAAPGRSVLARPTTTSVGVSLQSVRGQCPTPAVPLETSAAGLAAAASGDRPGEYRGRPLHLVKSRRFAWDYELPADGSSAGPLRAELWTTRDGGLTWQRTAVDPDGRSPIDVQLPTAGLYGVRLEIVGDAADAGGGPRTGDDPDAWVGLDEDPPRVELLGISRVADPGGDALLIRWSSHDPLLVPGATRLLFSPNLDGPWATIADSVANQGEHRWQPARTVPAQVFVRVEVTDAAGNVGGVTSPEAIPVAAPRVGGKLGGLRVLPSSTAP